MNKKSTKITATCFFYLLTPLLFLSPACIKANEDDWVQKEHMNLDPFPYCKEELIPGCNKSSNIDVCSYYSKFYTNISFLYMQGIEDGLELGISQKNTQELFSPSTTATFVKTDSTFHPAFRVGAGLPLDKTDWDLYAEYSWFQQEETFFTTAQSGGVIEPFWLYPLSSDDGASSVEGKWFLSLDILDSTFGKEYYLSQNNKVRPFFGARAAWISQSFTPSYVIRGEKISSRNESASWGLGLRSGVDTSWLLNENIHLLVNVSGAALFSRFHSLLEQENIANPGTLLFDLSESVSCVVPHGSSAIGFGWGSYFANSTFHVNITALYELHTFRKHNRLGSVFGGALHRFSNSCSDLSLHGMSLQVRFDF